MKNYILLLSIFLFSISTVICQQLTDNSLEGMSSLKRAGTSPAPTVCPSTVKDIEGNIYNTVIIGSQCWMHQLLRTTTYNDGTTIPIVTDNAGWIALSNGAFCNYNNDEKNAENYGRLYNWYAVSTGKLCPTGWHVPDDGEWTTLTNFLGGDSIAGGKMKEAGTEHWKSPNQGGSNSSGFGSVPGGYRFYFDGSFSIIGSYRLFWSATELSTERAWTRSLSYYGSGIFRGYHSKLYGISVRCVKN